jgi:hypothetical protein
MNRFAHILGFASLALFTQSAFAAGAPTAKPAAKFADKDLRRAASDKSSLFNDPSSKILSSDTGGHIAIRYTKSAIANGKQYGDQAHIEIEVTDPFNYYAKTQKASAPGAILGNVAYERVQSGHDLNARTAQGASFNLTRAKKTGAYRGTVDVAAALQLGDDLGVNLGNIGVSLAGQQGWNSRYGRTYPIATGQMPNVNLAPAVNP